tara:strand:- start:48 stop:788 length:741 start_codon:yes stop_codon:yes gene_type:complete
MRTSLVIILLSSIFSNYTLVDINASNYTDWVYFSFSTGEIIDVEEPGNSSEWDLGIMRNHFRTNSGSSGNGIGGAYVDSTSTWSIDTWDDISEVPEGAIFSPDGILDTIYDLQTHEFSEAPGSLVLETWGWVDIDNNYQFNYNNYVFIIRTATGEYAKFWPYSYYTDEGVSGYISIAYELGIPNNNCSNSGDINYDNILSILDIIIIRDHIIGYANLSSNEECEADINFDSNVDLLDIIYIINIIF